MIQHIPEGEQSGSVRPTVWVALWQAARPKTLVAAIVPVSIGWMLAFREESSEFLAVTLCALFALLLQVGTNFANDYGDFVRGADTPTRRGPARAVASGWIEPALMHRASILVLSSALLAGLPLAWWQGWELILLGVCCVICAYAYTCGPFPLAYHGLGDVFVIVFFGLVAVGGTYYVQTGAIATHVLVVGAGVGLMANNLLIANNLRDYETDRMAGKRTTVVRFGPLFGHIFMTISFFAAVLIPLILGILWLDPWMGLPILLLLDSSLYRRGFLLPRQETVSSLLVQNARRLLLYGFAMAAGLAL